LKISAKNAKIIRTKYLYTVKINNKTMADLNVVSDYYLRTVLEESNYFTSLSEEEKQKYLERISHLTNDQQRDLCVFFIREEKDTLPAKLMLRFLNKVTNSGIALGKVAEKDKAILAGAKASRQGEVEVNV
jgi:hypothetical protein